MAHFDELWARSTTGVTGDGLMSYLMPFKEPMFWDRTDLTSTLGTLGDLIRFNHHLFFGVLTTKDGHIIDK